MAGQGWCTPLIPALGRQRQGDLCEFKASLICRVSSRISQGYTKRNQKRKRKTYPKAAFLSGQIWCLL